MDLRLDTGPVQSHSGIDLTVGAGESGQNGPGLCEFLRSHQGATLVAGDGLNAAGFADTGGIHAFQGGFPGVQNGFDGEFLTVDIKGGLVHGIAHGNDVGLITG